MGTGTARGTLLVFGVPMELSGASPGSLPLESEHWVSAWPETHLGQLQGGQKGLQAHFVAILTAGKSWFVLGYRNLKFIQAPAFSHSIH